MQREVIKWLQSLDLSAPVRNPHRDLANGAIAAEIVSRYGDASIIRMQAISTGASSEERRSNWHTVHAALHKLRCTTVTPEIIDAILRLQPNAAQAALEHLYEFFTQRTLPVRTLDTVHVIPSKPKQSAVAAASRRKSDPFSGGSNRAAHGAAQPQRKQPAADADVQRFIGPKNTAPVATLLETTGEVAPGSLPPLSKPLSATATSNPNRSNNRMQLTGTQPEADEDALERERAGYVAATAVQEKLALTRNDTISGGVSALKQPRFAKPTAAALLHSANNSRYHVALGKEKFIDDDVQAQARNAKIMQQHDVLHKEASAKPLGEQPTRSTKKERRPSLTLTGLLRGPHSVYAVTFRRKAKPKTTDDKFDATADTSDPLTSGGAQKVEVNVMSDALRGALERHGVYLSGDERAGEKSIELFKSCDWILRDAFSLLLKDILVAHNDLYTLVELCGNHSEGSVMEDLFISVMAHRDDLSDTTMRACWTALEQNTLGIAAAVHAKPDQYSYMMQVLTFIFTRDAAQISMFHVTSSRDAEPGSPRARARRPSVGNTLLSTMRRSSKAFMSSSANEDVQPPRQKAYRSDRNALHLASAFVFLSRVGESLSKYCDKIDDHRVQSEVLRKYFMPAAKASLLACGTPAVVEAVSRVIVSTLAAPTASEEHREVGETLVTDFLSEDLAGEASPSTPKAAPLPWQAPPSATQPSPQQLSPFRQELVAFHVIRQLYRQRADAAADDAAVDDALSPIMIAHIRAMASRCLSSNNAHCRTIGVSLIVLLVAQSCWPEVLELVKSHMPLENWDSFANYGSSWELRVTTLHLLSVLSTEVAYLMTEVSENQQQTPQSARPSSAGPVRPPVKVDAVDKEELTPSQASAKEKEDKVAEMSNIIATLPLSLLEKGLVAVLRSLSAAPELPKQLALSIVSRSLLTSGQPRAVTAWLNSLLALKSETFHRCLLPYEEYPMPLGIESQYSSPHKHSKPQLSRSPGPVNEPVPPLQMTPQSESSIHVLMGRVEPVYVVAPLNQVWNTSSVIHVVLQRLSRIQPYRALTIIAAALISPQPVDLQSEELMRNLRVALAASNLASSIDSALQDGKELTLRDLVHTARTKLLFSMLKTAPPPKPVPQFAPDASMVVEISPEQTMTLMTEMEPVDTTSAFWSGVLYHLLPTLQVALGLPVDKTRGGGSGGVQRASAAGRLAPSDTEEDNELLPETAAAVLFTLFHKCAPSEVISKSAAYTSNPYDMIQFIVSWATNPNTTSTETPENE